jgi:hypothetical protein
MMTKIIFTAAIVLLLLLAGCNQAESTPVISEVEVAETAPYPPPPTPNRSTPISPYPEPTEDPVQPTWTPFSPPIPSEEKGVVIGQVLDEVTGEPLVHNSMVLGEIIPLKPAPNYSIGVHERSSPRAFSDDEGRFAISDIPPGTYVLLVWTPFEATIVQDPETESDLLVEVSAGQSVELGIIRTTPPKSPGD